ncbi:hypothetical protein [Methylobacterium brachiatum]|uniref:Uncharacterized protein n=1 Tax=Methylobacterium brachiatum TaxID=269660 RepID=A0AAJ1TRF4_9HYPH|nr:hypothetical protein [Methylobacterium brachiatum]MCB4802679.1 hypothetical protein [Methylobacterium brachiatum]MDQ0543306.1 hypothetical protein [Methylobacterium brachiatum]
MSDKKGHNSQSGYNIKALGMQLAMQLPRDRSQALAIIEHTRWLVENYLHVADCEQAAGPKKGELKIVR